MPVTAFPRRASGPAERLTDFLAHLRANNLAIGIDDGALAIRALTHVDAADPTIACKALSAMLAKTPEDRARFPDLFDAYWRNRGAARDGTAASPAKRGGSARPGLAEPTRGTGRSSAVDTPDDGTGAVSASGTGRLVASQRENLQRVDLRACVTKEDFEAALIAADALARALRDRRSRRTTADRRRGPLDLRRTVRRSLATGGEPLHLSFRRRKERPARLVVLCDVSGSMTVYARVFLAFVKGLTTASSATEAFLFHTRCVRITAALRDGDTLRAVNRLSLLAEGFGGGTKIGSNLKVFNDQYAQRLVDGRTVVMILSDGYDTDPPALIAQELARLKRRGCRIVWLNPLKGWRDYAPVAKGMAAALPYLDHFAAANTLASLEALAPEFARL